MALVTNTLFHAYQSELRKAFERAALREGFDVVVVVGRALGHANLAERAQNVVYDWLNPEAVDGAVLLASTLTNVVGRAPLEALVQRWGPLPKVSIGAELSPVPSITVDNRAGMRAAVDHLIEFHDCRRIGYLAGPSDNQEAQGRLEGYRYALEAHFLPFDPKLVEPCFFSFDAGVTAMRRLLERGRVFDAVVAANDAIAVGAAQVLSERGLPSPDRVRLIGFDDSPVAVSALLTSVAQPFHQLAVHAVEALRGAMQGRAAHQIAFCPRLALRDSCGCSRAAARGELPPVRKGQSLHNYLVTQRGPLAELLHEINAACFDWWSTRVERLLAALETAADGNEREFLRALDELVLEAVEDGVPVEQIGSSVSRLQRHFEDAGERVRRRHPWSRALPRIVATYGKAERKRRMESMQQLSALRDFSVGLWEVENERQLAERLARDLPNMGVRRAYLGLLDASERQFQPCLLRSGPGPAQLDGPPHAVQQLFPPNMPATDAPSSWLVSAVNAGPRATGVWACDGGTDIFIFEQLRTCIGGVVERLASRRAPSLEPPTLPLQRDPVRATTDEM